MPHLSEELWRLLGEKGLAILQKWPESLNIIKKTNYKIAIQINGKTKEIIEMDFTPNEKEMLDILKNNNKIKKMIVDKKIKRSIYVPKKIINILIE